MGYPWENEKEVKSGFHRGISAALNYFLTQKQKMSKMLLAGHQLNRFGEFSVVQLMWDIGSHAERRRLFVVRWFGNLKDDSNN
jgi:hypothetical protein